LIFEPRRLEYARLHVDTSWYTTENQKLRLMKAKHSRWNNI